MAVKSYQSRTPIREEREGAVRIRTLADILDYIETLQKKRAEDGGGA